jgi:hypothetical protein
MRKKWLDEASWKEKLNNSTFVQGNWNPAFNGKQ